MAANGNEPISKRLRRLRNERGLSQRDLSSPGVSYAYISRIEAGSRIPSVKALRKLAEKLDVTAEYLETGHDKTLVDALVEELGTRTGSVVRVTVGHGIAHVRWKVDGIDVAERASNMTEALLGAVARMRDRDELYDQQQRIVDQMLALTRQ